MNVHILSDTPRASSAYANITRNLASGLAERGHSITITGFLNGYENFHGINVLPLSTPFSPPQVQFSKNLTSSKAEVLICIFEAYGQFSIYSQMFSPTFFWVPLEGEGVTENMKQTLGSGTNTVPMSNAGKNQLESAHVQCRDAIYPGYDPSIFTKNPVPVCIYSMDIYQQRQNPKLLSERGCWHCTGNKSGCKYYENERITLRIAGKEFSGPLHALEKVKNNFGAQYVIGCVAQNTTRKRFERLIEAFSKMNTKDALLHLHTRPVSREGIDFNKIVKEFNVQERVVFSYSDNPVFGISDHGMNQLYNYFDFSVTASSYEGFGMPVLESESIGKAQVAPACATFPELLGNNERGLLASIATKVLEPDGFTRSLVDIENLAEKMDMLCTDPGLRRRLGDAGAIFAGQFTWAKVVRRWDELLSEIEEQQRLSIRR